MARVEVARVLSDYDLKKVVLVPGAAATSTGIRDVPLRYINFCVISNTCE